MKIHFKKTKAVVVSRDDRGLVNIVIDGQTVEQVTKERTKRESTKEGK